MEIIEKLYREKIDESLTNILKKEQETLKNKFG
jgi:hypothetical protein